MDADHQMTSSKPYLIRAIYEWILDNQLTPHLVVDADFPGTQVPREFVHDGRIVLNISPNAVRGLIIGNDWIEFSARFGGVARQLLIPTEAVVGIFSRENGQGMVFPSAPHPEEIQAPEETPPGPKLTPIAGGSEPAPQSPDRPKGKGKGPVLKVVK